LEAINWIDGAFLIMDIIFIIAFILLINTYLVKSLFNKFNIPSESYLWTLFIVHFILTSMYFLYISNARSDSYGYYDKSLAGTSWIGFFENGTSFIYFLAYPFVKLLSLSFISVMLLFSYFGYLAVLLFYIAAIENIKLNPIWNNLSAIELIFLLPNIHFWTSSLGKGSVITLGLGLFIFGLSRFNQRILMIIIGLFITYMIRPHVFFTLVVSTMIGVFITNSGIKPLFKWTILFISIFLFFYLSEDVLKFTNAESLDVFSSNNIGHRAAELSKANTGVDISNYSLGLKLFTFWFRPLFVDANGVFGILVSFENLFYLYFFGYVIKNLFFTWSKFNGWFRISILIFILGSIILAQITGNLGLAIRQKAQLMPFFFIVYCKLLSNNQTSNNLKIS